MPCSEISMHLDFSLQKTHIQQARLAVLADVALSHFPTKPVDVLSHLMFVGAWKAAMSRLRNF
jgi:hypothetical protein